MKPFLKNCWKTLFFLYWKFCLQTLLGFENFIRKLAWLFENFLKNLVKLFLDLLHELWKPCWVLLKNCWTSKVLWKCRSLVEYILNLYENLNAFYDFLKNFDSKIMLNILEFCENIVENFFFFLKNCWKILFRVLN